MPHRSIRLLLIPLMLLAAPVASAQGTNDPKRPGEPSTDPNEPQPAPKSTSGVGLKSEFVGANAAGAVPRKKGLHPDKDHSIRPSEPAPAPGPVGK